MLETVPLMIVSNDGVNEKRERKGCHGWEWEEGEPRMALFCSFFQAPQQWNRRRRRIAEAGGKLARALRVHEKKGRLGCWFGFGWRRLGRPTRGKEEGAWERRGRLAV